MNGSATFRIVEGEPIPEGTRVAFTAGDGLVVDAPGTVIRYYSVSRPIVEVVLDDGSHWLAQPWHLKAVSDES
ncbi:hypothetical protein SEA_SLEEPYHEAD_32 [Rhodococcus phage Sleepyhead]|uniref:Uncharacterized protein n=1 Tax=Rhodococcus phage Sleepyhead TaxID=2591131 RepID=A0A515MHB6_9CAUD|nr:hypothetical protein HWC38_gp32 [Rhodococcus phage Sleepyhead]QDM56047.1 hypothetical protein SEA_SLEEPYHEAD_32 [Rhodococcus phage Sleepyhead]